MGQGQAVGTVAALAVKKGVGVRGVSTSELQDTLAAQEAEFGRTGGEPNRKAIEEVGQLPLDEPPTTGDKDAPSSMRPAWVADTVTAPEK